MFRARHIATCLLVLGVIALAVPAVTLAQGGGGSAGDQQYTDPFSHSQTQTASPTPATTSPAPAPTTPSSAGGSGSGSSGSGSSGSGSSGSGSSGSGSSGSGSSGSDSTTPTATTASPSATTGSGTSGGSAGTLPYTGFDSWAAGALGLVLVGGGLGLRRVARRA